MNILANKMRLYTKDYIKFTFLDDNGQPVKEVEGVENINKCLPGDEITIDGSLVKRIDHPILVGILHVSSKIKYGITSKGVPIYLFEPINKGYPIMIAGSTEKNVTKNILVLARFESWGESKYPRANLIRILGHCGEEVHEKEALLYRYSPWSYPKQYSLSPNYISELQNRKLIEGYTFNIDPPACEDVDDVITIKQVSDTQWNLIISITDVASGIDDSSALDIYSQLVGQSLYPSGQSPKHMLPPSLGIKELSLLPGLERNCISVSIHWSEGKIIQENWIVGKVKVDNAYTYKEAFEEKNIYMDILSKIVTTLSGKELLTAEEWIETLMIYYNKEAGKLLKSNGTGILRGHSEPNQERMKRWSAIDPSLEKLAYSSAEYIPANLPAHHWGLNLSEYAHVSSPLRRYADLHNQRCLLAILNGTRIPPLVPSLCRQLNLLQKDAKAFDRDMFFIEALNTRNPVQGTLVEIQEEKQALQFWVPLWNRIVRIKSILRIDPPSVYSIQKDTSDAIEMKIGKKYRLDYYIQYQNARWKDKIIFSITSEDTNCLE